MWAGFGINVLFMHSGMTLMSALSTIVSPLIFQNGVGEKSYLHFDVGMVPVLCMAITTDNPLVIIPATVGWLYLYCVKCHVI